MSHAPDVPVCAADFAKLLQRARQGDAAALGALLQHHRPYLLFVANQELGDNVRGRAGPSDLVQDTLLRGQQRFEQFRGTEEEEFRAWLRVILRHQVTDFVRGLPKQRHEEVDSGIPDDGDTPSGGAARQDEIEMVREALAQLPDHYQQVVRLREYEGLTYEEIGQRIQCSSEAARKVWTRAIDQLGQILKSTHGE